MKLIYENLGKVPYLIAFERQIATQEKVMDGADDHLFLLEHPKVITVGLNADEANLLVDDQTLSNLGYEVHHIRRGGDVTYHGPGQIVGYMIFNLKKKHGGSIRTFVDKIEEVIISTLKDLYGIESARDPINAGVFVGNDKIAAIGLSVNKGVTMHGFALNANTALGDYSPIVPCGLKTRSVTSVEKCVGSPVDIETLKTKLHENIIEQFGFDKKGEIES